MTPSTEVNAYLPLRGKPTPKQRQSVYRMYGDGEVVQHMTAEEISTLISILIQAKGRQKSISENKVKNEGAFLIFPI